MNPTNQIPRTRLLTLLLTAVTVLFLVSVQAYHFHYRPYRQDEAWVVHYALKNIERVGFLDHLLQIFNQIRPENVLQDAWVHLFGHTENIVRYFSTLTTVITLALFYRLAADLFGRYSAWLALVLLGTYSVFVFYSHEARPYAALALGHGGFPVGAAAFYPTSRSKTRRDYLAPSRHSLLSAPLHCLRLYRTTALHFAIRPLGS